MTRIFVFSLVLIFTSVINSQNSNNINEKLYNEAVSLYERGDNVKAISLFKRVLNDQPDNINVLYNIGHCYLTTNNRSDSASIYFNQAIEHLAENDYNTEFGIDLFMSMASANQLQYKFEDAIVNYNQILGFIDNDYIELKEAVNRQIEICNNGILLMKTPVHLEVHNLGNQVNSKYDDHSPLINVDENMLLFTSKRISSYSQIMDDGQFSEKVYVSKLKEGTWEKSEILSSVVKRNSHESAVCISADGTELYMLISNIEGQNLYVSNYDGETWSEPFKLPSGINSIYNETHASINPDKSILFFTSDRKGGFGGLDIYMARKLPNGEWGTPRNLGKHINTQYDEETPMIHPNGKTLYFSSKGHNTMGNFDIFYSAMNADSSWTQPMNMGYPINTPDDDFFFVPTASPNKAYMASSRFEDNQGRSDLYLIEYEEPYENKLAVIKGKLHSSENTAWENISILVKEKGNDELVGEYKPNHANGNYLLILEADKKYELQYQGNGFTPISSQLDISKEMTYHKNAKTITLDDVWVKEIEKPAQDTTQISEKKEEYKYTIQFLTIDQFLVTHKEFATLDPTQIMVYKCADGQYRYVFGQFNSFKEALKMKQEVIKVTGYSDPFVRYFWQLEKMKVQE
jgi:tetratricopeptide (TPR) repeat protein